MASRVRPLGAIAAGGDGYEYFSCPNTGWAQIQVLNGAIDYAIAEGPSAALATFPAQNDTLLPGSGFVLGPFHAIRLANHPPTSSPAPQVSITAREERTRSPLAVEGGWTPSYAVVEPDGSIGANFSGHVQAKGLDLPTSVGSPPATDNQIRWTPGATGSGKVSAFAAGVEAGDQRLAKFGIPSDNAEDVQAELSVVDAAFATEVGFRAIRTLIGARLAQVAAGARSAKVLDDAGVSDFMFGADPASLQQSPAIAFLGDIDQAKWIVRLGGFKLTFSNDSGDPADLGTGQTTYRGRIYKPKFELGEDGTLRGYKSQAALTLPLTDAPGGSVGASGAWARDDHRHPLNVDSVNPVSDGTASPGAAAVYARRDHVHPLNVDGTNPGMDGTAAPGTAATYARRDHIHPSDTSRLRTLLGAGTKVDGGAGTIRWGGGNALSQATGVNHGLGVVPAVILALCTNLSGGIVCAPGITLSPLPTSTVITFNARTVDASQPANNTTTVFYWAAFG